MLFGEFLLRDYKAPRSVTNAFSSVRAFHLDSGMDASAFSSRQLSLFRRALPITLRHVPARAPPLPFLVLERLCTAARERGTEGVVFAALLAVTFFAMSRLSSLAHPSTEPYDFTRYPSFADVRVVSGQVSLQLKWGKCSQAAEQGFSVPLLPLKGSRACPVALLATLAAQAAGPPESTPLFCLTRRRRRAGRARPQFLTAGSARSWLSSLLQQLGLSGEGYTFHTLRRGACSRAYREGASLPDLQFLGGWRGESIHLYAPAEAARARAAKYLTARINPS